MPQTYQYRTLDVFTDTAYKGNQLAVVANPASNPLTQDQKHLVANEFNYSETIFVSEPSQTSSPPAPIKVDIFTTTTELPFAGHPTIGAIDHILTHIHPTHDTITLTLQAGPVQGHLDRTTGFARAEIPHTFHRHGKQITWPEIVRAQPTLSTTTPKSSLQTQHHALVSIVQGMNFALIDLTRTPDLLSQIRVTNADIVPPTDLDPNWPGTLVGNVFFIRHPTQNDDDVVRIDQRVIVIGLEDPATGSACCALSVHLALERAAEGKGGTKHRFEIVQGEQMGRRSVVGVEVVLDQSGNGVERVVLMGRCRGVMRGELEI